MPGVLNDSSRPPPLLIFVSILVCLGHCYSLYSILFYLYENPLTSSILYSLDLMFVLAAGFTVLGLLINLFFTFLVYRNSYRANHSDLRDWLKKHHYMVLFSICGGILAPENLLLLQSKCCRLKIFSAPLVFRVTMHTLAVHSACFTLLSILPLTLLNIYITLHYSFFIDFLSLYITAGFWLIYSVSIYVRYRIMALAPTLNPYVVEMEETEFMEKTSPRRFTHANQNPLETPASALHTHIGIMGGGTQSVYCTGPTTAAHSRVPSSNDSLLKLTLPTQRLHAESSAQNTPKSHHHLTKGANNHFDGDAFDLSRHPSIALDKHNQNGTATHLDTQSPLQRSPRNASGSIANTSTLGAPSTLHRRGSASSAAAQMTTAMRTKTSSNADQVTLAVMRGADTPPKSKGSPVASPLNGSPRASPVLASNPKRTRNQILAQINRAKTMQPNSSSSSSSSGRSTISGVSSGNSTAAVGVSASTVSPRRRSFLLRKLQEKESEERKKEEELVKQWQEEFQHAASKTGEK